MERRKAPASFIRRIFLAFEIVGLPCLAVIVALFFIKPDWPIWGHSLLLGAAFILGLYLFVRFLRNLKCPECGRVLNHGDGAELKQRPLTRFVCSYCKIEWEVWPSTSD